MSRTALFWGIVFILLGGCTGPPGCRSDLRFCLGIHLGSSLDFPGNLGDLQHLLQAQIRRERIRLTVSRKDATAGRNYVRLWRCFLGRDWRRLAGCCPGRIIRHHP